MRAALARKKFRVTKRGFLNVSSERFKGRWQEIGGGCIGVVASFFLCLFYRRGFDLIKLFNLVTFFLHVFSGTHFLFILVKSVEFLPSRQ